MRGAVHVQQRSDAAFVIMTRRQPSGTARLLTACHYFALQHRAGQQAADQIFASKQKAPLDKKSTASGKKTAKGGGSTKRR